MSDALVSVIIRTIHRPTLLAAIKSVERQTYSNLEIVLVDALGCGFQTAPENFSFLPVVTCSQGIKLGYGDAANLGLDHARGDYLIFLDDDDFFDAEHIESLLEILTKNSPALLAYSGTRLVNNERQETGFFFVPFAPLYLYRSNFIQMGAALFSRDLMAKGCRFDPALDAYVDWDFWLQALQHGPFAFSGKATNNWCAVSGSSGSGLGSNFDGTLVLRLRNQLITKWQQQHRALLAIFNHYFTSGCNALETGNAVEAEHQFIAALKLDCTSTVTLNMLAKLYTGQRRYNEADRVLLHAIQEEPANPDLHFNRALLWRNAGKFDESLKAIDQVLKISPHYNKALDLRSQLIKNQTNNPTIS